MTSKHIIVGAENALAIGEDGGVLLYWLTDDELITAVLSWAEKMRREYVARERRAAFRAVRS